MADANMKNRIAEFKKVASVTEQQLREVIGNITEGRVPSKEEQKNLEVNIENLQKAYDQVYELIVSLQNEKEPIENGLSAYAYEKMYSEFSALHLNAQIKELKNTLSEFVAVKSFISMYAQALQPFQQEATNLLVKLDAAHTEQTIAEIDQNAIGTKLFLDAMKIEDMDSTQGESLIDQLDLYYPSKVLLGLTMKKYYVETGADETRLNLKGNPPETASYSLSAGANLSRTEDLTHCSHSAGTDIPAVPVKRISPHVPENSELTKKDNVITPYKKLKNQVPSASAFKRDIRGYAEEVRTIIPLLTNMGALTEEQILRFGRCVADFEADQEVRSRVSNVLKQLTSKNLMVAYKLDETGGDVYCLTPYCVGCLKKSTISVQMKTFWTTPLGCFYYPAQEELLRDEVRLILSQNDQLLTYLEWVHQTYPYDVYEIVQESISRQQNRYTIRLPNSEGNERCSIVFRDCLCAELASSPVLCIDDTPPVDIEIQDEATSFGVYYFYKNSLFKWDGGWNPFQSEYEADSIADALQLADKDKSDDTPSKAPMSNHADIEKSRFSKADPNEAISQENYSPDDTLFDRIAEPQVSSSAELANKILLRTSVCISNIDLGSMILQLLKENSIMEATVFSKTVAITQNIVAETIFKQLLFATNSSLGTPGYSSLSIAELEKSVAEYSTLPPITSKILHICNLLWAYVFPSQAYDSSLYNTYKSLFAVEIDDMFAEKCGALKQISSLLTGRLYDVTVQDFDGLGFSAMSLNLIRSDAEKRGNSHALHDKAVLINKIPKGGIFTGFDVFLSHIIGPSGELGKCMDVIISNQQEKFEYVKSIFTRFTNSPHDILLSQQKIEDFIDDEWMVTRKRCKEIKVKMLKSDSHARNIAKREIASRLEVISEWLHLTNVAHQSTNPNAIKQLKEIHDQLLQLVQVSIEQINVYLREENVTADKIAGMNVLAFALGGIRNHLLGMEKKKWEYIPLLSSHQMYLDESYYPAIDPANNTVQGFEPWRRMLQHIASHKITLETALTYIENESEKQVDWFANYGVAEIIAKYLSETQGRPCRDLSNAHRGAKMECKRLNSEFESEFRLACAYGRIEEETEETAFQIVTGLGSQFIQQNNYAYFRELLLLLIKSIPAEAEKRKAYFESQLTELVKARGNNQVAMIAHIETALREENFALAQEYINRLRDGETDIPADEARIDAEPDFHKQFIECYPEYYNECNKAPNRMDYPKNWGYKALRGKLPTHWSSPNEEKKAERLLNSWIGGKGISATEGLIRQFLCAIGFDARQVIKRDDLAKSDQYEVYRVTTVPQTCGKRDYDHPVFKFGTALGVSMNVVCLFGCKGTSTVVNIMTKRLQLDGPTLVLLEGILNLEERRIIAATFKALTSGQSSFLLIDRVLLLYLASLDEGDRMVAMLRCTLPYTFEQLFTKGTGTVPDEMFIGRISERNDICNENGACLVYGGRQLGKTALLMRCKSIQHTPEEKLYAYHIDVKGKNSFGLLEGLKKVLIKEKFVSTACNSLDMLCDELMTAYNKRLFVRLQVFIDEVDYFFAEAAEDEYELLRPFINLMKKTKNKIKFVFVGLHNVAHTKSAIQNNGLLLQMGTPLCIAPLSPTDARKLIERPLSYLGFTIGKRELALILASTNNYPGLLHLFGYSLLQSVCDNYADYYSPQRENPPYEIQAAQMKAVFAKEDLEKEINLRVSATINGLDEKYKIIANLLAYLHYEDESAGRVNLYGYTPEEICFINVACLQEYDSADFSAILGEMVDMGILSYQRDQGTYRLRKVDFLSVIGNPQQVEDNILTGTQGV